MQRPMHLPAALAGAALVLACASAHAHMPYLLPNLFDVGKRDHVTVQGAFTEEFFSPDVAMKATDYHAVMPDGSKQPLTPAYSKDLAVIEVPTTTEGTYRISTGIRTGRTARAAWVNDDWQFLERDAQPPAGSSAYEVTSITTAETYVTRGKPTETAVRPRGTGLEFHAVTHPNALFVGSAATFVVLFDGKPVPRQRITVYSDDMRYSDQKSGVELTSDDEGRLVVKRDASGTFVAMTRYRPAPAAGSQKAVSYTYSVVLEATE